MHVASATETLSAVAAAAVPTFAPDDTGFHFDVDVEEFTGFPCVGLPVEEAFSPPAVLVAVPTDV